MCSGKMRRYMEEHQWRRRVLVQADAEARKRGEQIGLPDTLVVHAVNDED